MPPTIKRSSFGRGLRWLPAGAELMFSALAPLAGLAALWLLVSLIAVVPIIGQGILAVITPLLTAGALQAFSMIAQGQRPAPTVLFAGWQDSVRRGRLLLVGLWGIFGSLVAVSILAGWLGTQLGPEQLEAAMASPEALAQTLSEVSLGGGLLLAALVMAAVLATMYFAIPLIMFGHAGVATALVTSLKAVGVNLLAFLGLGVAVMLLVLGLGLIMMLLLSVLALALGAAGQILSQVLFLLMTMFIQILMAGAQFVACRDIFELPRSHDDNSDENDSGRFIA